MKRMALILALLLAAAPLLAAPLLDQGRADDALRVLRKQVESAPQDAQAYHLLSRTYFALQKWDDAVRMGERAVALAPNNSDYHMWLGRAYGEKAGHSSFITAFGLTKKIRREFEQAVELDAHNVLARTDLAEFYIEAPGFLGGGKDKAQQQAQELARQDEARAHWVQARIAEKDKNYGLAEREFRAAIQASDNQASYWLNLASFYRRIDRLSDMKAAIDSAMTAHRKSGVFLVDAARCLFGAGKDLASAALLVRKYLANGPTAEEAPVFQAHYLLGQILEKQGEKQQAAQQYRAALELAKDYDRAREALERLEAR
jgi:tetratricopeptide (TPR) repeat protein